MSPPKNGASKLCTVVIATLCEEGRAALLKRAVESIRAMAGGLDYSIMVVANGPRVSQELVDWLTAAPDVRVVRLRSGSHPLARRVGAELADAEFLAFLDDDDELLPDTLVRKVAYFREHPEIDALVTDGFRVIGSSRTRIFPQPAERRSDLVETMMSAGWGAGALTLRAQNIDLSVFDTELRHLEWTLTTLQLARRHRFGFLDEPTYLYYEDTPDSLSKHAEHSLAAPLVWSRLSRSYTGTRYEKIVRQRYGRHCRNASWEYLRRGETREAWRLSLEALRSPGGVATIPSALRLLLASTSRLFLKRDSFAKTPATLDSPIGEQRTRRPAEQDPRVDARAP